MRVAGARNQAEAEFIQGLLLEEGVPSLLRRTAGFDVPDFLAAGPRDVLVPASGALAAREVLLQAELITSERPARVDPVRLLIGLLLALAAGAAVIWLSVQLCSDRSRQDVEARRAPPPAAAPSCSPVPRARAPRWRPCRRLLAIQGQDPRGFRLADPGADSAPARRWPRSSSALSDGALAGRVHAEPRARCTSSPPRICRGCTH